jgi:hypothetical protein
LATKLPWYWSERTHQKWQRVRARGIAHFVLVRGALGWGGSMFAFFTIYFFLFANPSSAKLSTSEVLEALVICRAGGLGWGALTWFATERTYRKHVDGAP